MNNFIHIALKDKRKAKAYTAVIMMLFLLLLILVPFFSYENPPPGQPGLLVSFGEVGVGQGNEASPKSEPTKAVKEEKQVDKPKTKPEPEKSKSKEKTSKPKEEPKEVKTPIDEKIISARNEAIALEKQKAKEEADRKAKADAQARAVAAKEAEKEKAKKLAAEKLQQEKAAEEARLAEAARKQKEADDLKKNLLGAFGQGDGKGDTGNPGNQGVNDGDPDADALKGLSTGIGQIGGGLQGRGGKGPSINDNSNKTGTVVVKVCIDANGKVTTVNYTQKGSTTQDATLIKLAVDNARDWRFNSGTADTTCGTITYDFKVK